MKHCLNAQPNVTPHSSHSEEREEGGTDHGTTGGELDPAHFAQRRLLPWDRGSGQAGARATQKLALAAQHGCRLRGGRLAQRAPRLGRLADPREHLR
eukprot:2925980-Prymnesium_polylepis.1